MCVPIKNGSASHSIV